MGRKKDIFGTALKVISILGSNPGGQYRGGGRSSYRSYSSQVNKYEREKVREELRRKKEILANQKSAAISLAAEQTSQAEKIREMLQSILLNAVNSPIRIDYLNEKIYSVFSEQMPREPKYKIHPEEIYEREFVTEFTFWDKISRKRREKKINEANDKLHKAQEDRLLAIERIDKDNALLKERYEKELYEWQKRKNEHDLQINELNRAIDEKQEKIYEDSSDMVSQYFESIMERIDLPECIKTDWELVYDLESKIMVIDYILPDIECIPNLKTMKYISTRNEFSETYIKQKEIDDIFQDMLFQISLRITNDIYKSDIYNRLSSIVFNGMYIGINKSTGLEEKKCIMSLQTLKEEFAKIIVNNVDATSCFLSFKGMSGAKLTELIPVAPILEFNKEDKRFVQGKKIEGTINGTNLASMDWEEFEHLIRELFEKEFVKNDAEIRITQASRDGGVDAVMFDPDPIRGGKYIIQAKRYTNIVGVSAVRDLYGTLMNEGAVKGILVTTSNFGADSYEFAKDKPITLINGSNLLNMLQKNGYQARIDIEEAKKTLHET